jgi:serine protease inhibitor
VLKLSEEGAGRPDAVPQPFRMVVDRPFLFVLRHTETGAIVLLGLINDPRKRGRG